MVGQCGGWLCDKAWEGERAFACHPCRRVAGVLVAAWWRSGWWARRIDGLSPVGLQDAAAQVVAEAVRLLDRKVAQDLATTDSTKTSLGALWDLPVVVLDIVAMASGRADGEAWVARMLHTLWKRVAQVACVSRAPKRAEPSQLLLAGKVVYCCLIVPLGLIVAPATVLWSDLLAREDNPDGGSSELGWLSTEIEPELPNGRSFLKHVVVGVVSVRTTTV